MDAGSFQFVLFGLAAAIVSNFSRNRAWRSAILLVASVGFLGLLAHNPAALLPLFVFLLLGYAGLFLIQRGWSKSAAWSILAILCAYIWLKKYSFLPQAILLHHPYFTLGLSYIFFRVLHLLIEARDSREKSYIGVGRYLLYTVNFTALISGPIQRYDEFARDQFANEPISLGPRVIGLQLERVIRGFFKINVLAVIFDMLRQDALAQMLFPLPASSKYYAAFWLCILYPLFLYCNFSGYIDIVIALARLMRVRLPENFDRPFSATSFIDFWNCWHITLSTWFKTYIYNPLMVALMRRFSSPATDPFLAVICFFVAFFLVGLWHGRTSEFVMYGVLQGAGVSINKLWQLAMTRALGRKGYRDLNGNIYYVSFSRGLTFSWFAFTLFWFWASWQQIGRCFSAIGIVAWLVVWVAVWLSASLVLGVWERLRAGLLSIRTTEGPILTGSHARVVYASALGLTAFVFAILLSQPAPAIVYKGF